MVNCARVSLVSVTGFSVRILKLVMCTRTAETYYDQVEMMDGFIEACKAVDKKKNGKKGGRLGGTLKRPEFMETLKSYFKFKSVEDLALLQQAVIYDQPLPVIKYMKLFDETRDGDRKSCLLE